MVKKCMERILNSGLYVWVCLVVQIVFATIVIIVEPNLYWHFVYFWCRFIFGAWGTAIAGWTIINRKMVYSPQQVMLIVFSLVVVVSHCITGPYGIYSGAFNSMLLQISCCCALYSAGGILSTQEMRKIIKSVAIVYVVFYFVICTLSLFLYYNDIHLTLFNGIELYQYQLGSSLYGHGKIRYDGLYTNPVPAGIHCAVAILMQIWLLTENKNKLLMAAGSCNILAQAWMLVLCDGRTGYCILIFALLPWMFAKIKNIIGSKIYLYSFSLCIVLLLVCQFVLGIPIVQKVLAIRHYSFANWNSLLSNRLALWKMIVDEFLRHPLFCDGWFNAAIAGAFNYPYPHSSFFNVMLYLGSAGLIPYLCFVIYSFMKIRKGLRGHIKDSIGFLALIAFAIFVGSHFDNLVIADSIYVETALFWVILGYVSNCKLNDGIQDNAGGL